MQKNRALRIFVIPSPSMEAMSKPKARAHAREEKWNVISHGLGIVLALAGSMVLLSRDLEGIPHLKTGVLVYCLSLILLFSASTAYHATTDPKRRKNLRILDHIGIYYLIAGTYTPVCLALLQDSLGWVLLYLVWGIALFGTFLKLFYTGKFETFSLILYGVMGWLVVIDLPYLIGALAPSGLVYLALGGAFYTIGILFYALRKIPFNHLIWHLFVLAGAASHWMLIVQLI